MEAAFSGCPPHTMAGPGMYNAPIGMQGAPDPNLMMAQQAQVYGGPPRAQYQMHPQHHSQMMIRGPMPQPGPPQYGQSQTMMPQQQPKGMPPNMNELMSTSQVPVAQHMSPNPGPIPSQQHRE